MFGWFKKLKKKQETKPAKPLLAASSVFKLNYASKSDIPDVSGLMKQDGSNAALPVSGNPAADIVLSGGNRTLSHLTQANFISQNNLAAKTDIPDVSQFQTAAQVSSAVAAATAGFIKTVATDGKTITGDGVKTPLAAGLVTATLTVS